MSIIVNDPISKQDIIDRFNTRVKDWVVANTNWTAATPVWDTNLGYVVSHSTAAGAHGYPAGLYNRSAFPSTSQELPTEPDFSSEIGAKALTTGHVVNVLKNFMTLYANTHKMQLMNTGNYTPSRAVTTHGTIPYVGVARLDGVVPVVKTNVETDLAYAAENRNVKTGEPIEATNLLALIEDCRAIWTNRCLNVISEEFRYNYCHSSCHSNHGSHGSRGRR